MERRHSPRRALPGAAVAMGLPGRHFGRFFDLRMIDFSDTGMSGLCDEPIDPGTPLTLGFEPKGLTARQGVAVSCTPVPRGPFRIGVRFEQRLAA